MKVIDPFPRLPDEPLQFRKKLSELFRDIAEKINPIWFGTWTPDITHVANVAASTARECMYVKVGPFVVCAGAVDIDPTLAVTTTQLRFSLPIPSNFTTTFELRGLAQRGGTTTQSINGIIISQSATDDALFTFICDTDAANYTWTMMFLYRVQS